MVDEPGEPRHRQIVDAFLAASRNGDFAALVALLDPGVVLRADQAAVLASAARRAEGAPPLAPEVHGPETVAATFAGRARAARPAVVDGTAGLVWAPGGQPRAVLSFTIVDGKIVAIDLIGDPGHIARLDIELLAG